MRSRVFLEANCIRPCPFFRGIQPTNSTVFAVYTTMGGPYYSGCGGCAPRLLSTTGYQSYAATEVTVPTTTGAILLDSAGLPLTVNCQSTATFIFAGSFVWSEEGGDSVELSVKLGFNNNSTGSTTFITVPVKATLTPGVYVPITAVQTTCLSPGTYTVLVQLSTGASFQSVITVSGTLSFTTTKKFA